MYSPPFLRDIICHECGVSLRINFPEICGSTESVGKASRHFAPAAASATTDIGTARVSHAHAAGHDAHQHGSALVPHFHGGGGADRVPWEQEFACALGNYDP